MIPMTNHYNYENGIFIGDLDDYFYAQEPKPYNWEDEDDDEDE